MFPPSHVEARKSKFMGRENLFPLNPLTEQGCVKREPHVKYHGSSVHWIIAWPHLLKKPEVTTANNW